MRLEDYLITNSIHQYPLYSIGVNSNAYVFEDAIKIIGYARDNIVPILGCDVYFIKNNEILIPEVFYGWYCDIEQDQREGSEGQVLDPSSNKRQ